MSTRAFLSCGSYSSPSSRQRPSRRVPSGRPPEPAKLCPAASSSSNRREAPSARRATPSLGAALVDVNNGSYTGVITIDVCGDTTEGTSAVLNASGTGGSSYTGVTIAPAGGVPRTISGGIAAILIDLNGAGGVVIDGLNSGGNALTIENTSTAASAATIRFIGDASGNTVRNSTIKGATTGTSSGTIVFATGTTTGNTE